MRSRFKRCKCTSCADKPGTIFMTIVIGEPPVTIGTILINTWWMFVACAIIYSLIFQDTWETFWKSLS